MKEQDAAAFAERWVEAWNRGDVEEVLAHFAEDAAFTSPLAAEVVPESRGVIRGRAALRSYWNEALRGNPHLHFDLLNVYFGTDTLVIRFRNQDGVDRCEVLTFTGDRVTAGHGTYLVAGSH